jgi:hypothetical protein
MSRPRALVPLDAIRIEDEVWQEAFSRRESSKSARPRGPAAVAEPPSVDLRPSRPNRAPKTVRLAPAQASAPPAPVPASSVSVAVPWPSDDTREPTADAVAAITPAEPRRAVAPDADPGVPPVRRTVTIRGYGADRNLPWTDTSRRRPQRPVYERAGFRPDRVAMWAVLLGILLVVVAIASAHG